MIEFIFANFELVGGIIVILAMLIYGLFTRQWSIVRISAYQLMLSAERLMATAEGKEKFEAVFADLWKIVPRWLKAFATESVMREKLQAWYNIAKDMLKDEAERAAIQNRLNRLF